MGQSLNVSRQRCPQIYTSLHVITELDNSSLMASVFPEKWKESKVIPLLKEGDHETANNNRPFSLLPAVSKIRERAALNQLMEYMSRLTIYQSGNKKLHSTETFNIFITEMIFGAIDSKCLTALVLLDISKDLDNLDHNILLCKLRTLGVSKRSIEWFKSQMSVSSHWYSFITQDSGTECSTGLDCRNNIV